MLVASLSNRLRFDFRCRVAAVLLALCAFGSALAQQGGTPAPAGAPNTALETLAIEDLFKLQVGAVTRHPQTLSDAPAAVTVITAEDIRRFGYRTLGDVIGGIKGSYVDSDRVYQYLGFRGFARSGDYNTRVLLLIDGNRINDNVYDQAAIGGEFPLEIESVERVEFVPGPGSALYGSNAFFGVINVITRHKDSKPGTLAVVKADSRNRWTAWGGHTGVFGEDGRFSLDIAQSGGAGPSLYYPSYDASATNSGRENGVDFEKAQRLWAKATVAGFSASLIHSDRSKGLSGAPYGVSFNDAASLYRDAFTSLDASKNVALSGQLYALVRGFWGEYRFQGAYAYPAAIVNRDLSQGNWYGAETRLTWRGWRGHTVLAGLDIQRDNKMLQRNFDVDPYALYLDDSRQRSRHALYLQDEWRLGTTILTLGLRQDRVSDAAAATNPRLSWVLPIGSGYVFKSVYGTAFRAPNVYEKYYASPASVPALKANPGLKPERIRSLDLILERSFGSWSAGLNCYFYRMTDLIQQGVDPADGSLLFTNIAGVSGRGVDAEIKHRWANGAFLQASVSLQAARETQTGERSVNSPSRLAKLRFALPLSSSGTTLAFDMQGVSSRRGDLDTVPGYGSANLVLSGLRPAGGLELGAGIYNLFNATVLHPVSASAFSFNAMQQDQRRLQLWVRYQL